MVEGGFLMDGVGGGMAVLSGSSCGLCDCTRPLAGAAGCHSGSLATSDTLLLVLALPWNLSHDSHNDASYLFAPAADGDLPCPG